MNEYNFSDLREGMSESFTKTVTEEMERCFRQITGDMNPLHSDDSFATQIMGGQFVKHVSFGMLTASLYSTLAGVYLPGKFSLIHSFEELSFTKPVYAGDTLTVLGEIAEKWDGLNMILVKARIKNEQGKTVSKAKIKIKVLQ